MREIKQLLLEGDLSSRAAAWEVVSIVTDYLWAGEWPAVDGEDNLAQMRSELRSIFHLARQSITSPDVAVRRSSLIAYYWLLRYLQDVGTVDPRLAELLLDIVRSDEPMTVRLAAAISFARLRRNAELEPAIHGLFRDAVQIPVTPEHDIFIHLGGDVRDAIRESLDGDRGAYTLFSFGCESHSPWARWQNIGQCRRLMEDWRDAPAELVPVLAARLSDESLPVRAAAAGAIHQSGKAAAQAADQLATALEDAARGAPAGNTDIKPVESIRAHAMAALVAVGDARALDVLHEYLISPFGLVETKHIIAQARGYAAELTQTLKLILGRSRRDDPEAMRHLADVLDGLSRWGESAEPFIPDLADLLAHGISTHRVLDVIAQIGVSASCLRGAVLAVLKSTQDPWLRAAAAKALLAMGGPSVDVAAASLTEMVQDDQQAVAGIRALADVPFVATIIEERKQVLEAAQRLLRSEIPSVRAAAARVAAQCGGNKQQCVAILLDCIGPWSVGIRAVEWLAELGEEAYQCRPLLEEALTARRRPRHHGQTGFYPVLADEAYQAAIQRALKLIPSVI